MARFASFQGNKRARAALQSSLYNARQNRLSKIQGFEFTELASYFLDYRAYHPDDFTQVDSNNGEGNLQVRYWKNHGPDGSDLDAAQDSPGFQPIWRGFGLEFDGVDDRLVAGSTGDFNDLHDGTGMSIYIVGQISSSKDNARGGILSTASNGTLAGLVIAQNDLAGWGLNQQFRVLVGNGSAGVYDEFTNNPGLTDPFHEFDQTFVLSIRDSADSGLGIAIDENAATEEDPTPNNTHGSGDSGALNIGYYASHFFGGRLFRVLAFKERLTDAQDLLVQKALALEAAQHILFSEMDSIQMMLHAEHNLTIDAYDLVTQWYDMKSQDPNALLFNLATYDATGHNGKPAVTLPYDAFFKAPLSLGGSKDVWIGDRDTGLLRAFLMYNEKESTYSNQTIEQAFRRLAS